MFKDLPACFKIIVFGKKKKKEIKLFLHNLIL